jgi:hypothetical protein
MRRGSGSPPTRTVAFCWKCDTGSAGAVPRKTRFRLSLTATAPREIVVRSEPEDRKVNGLRHFLPQIAAAAASA